MKVPIAQQRSSDQNTSKVSFLNHRHSFGRKKPKEGAAQIQRLTCLVVFIYLFIPKRKKAEGKNLFLDYLAVQDHLSTDSSCLISVLL